MPSSKIPDATSAEFIMDNTAEPVSGWIRLHSEPGPDLKLFHVRFDEMRNPRNGATERMVVLCATDSVNVVASTAEGNLVFVRQYRFGIGRETTELPGGIVDPDENPLEGAKRELREETGFTAPHWHYLGKVASNPVFMDSYIHHYLAQGAAPTHPLQPDAGESIEILEISLDEARQMLFGGVFEHPHTVSGLLNFFARHNGPAE
jgi:8-oxo-dGTP pyrophosphatase MutT (NUDIX family)